MLHKGHLAPAARYSEDIDLVLLKPMDKDALDARLRRVLTPVLGEPSEPAIADAWLTLRNVVKPSKLLRTVYTYVPLGLRYPMKIKVEVNLNENASLFALVDVAVALLNDEGDLTQCRARSYDIDEMLGTKLRALMQRKAGRDLFDLYHAVSYAPRAVPPGVVNGARAIEAFDWYLENEGTQMGREEAEQLLQERLKNQAFRKDIDTMLRPDFGRYDVDAAATRVREEYFRHLR